MGAETAFEGTGRFQVDCILGRGASGVVYRVRDREAERDVALKTLASVDADWRFRLKAEFRSLASVLHPNLVELYELVSDDRHCFFTMELLEGSTFSAAFPPGQAGRDLARLGAVSAEVVEALEAVHAAGKLHRDVKPSNVIVTAERAVLVDFGLCAELRMLRRGGGELAGTLLYMAPEQAWARPLSPAADWYALGAMTYEALVGAPAFPGTGSTLLMAKQRAPEVPAHLSGAARDAAIVCARLMHPDPARRAAPEELLDALDAPTSSRRARGAAERTGTAREPTKAAFVGRDEELAVLEAAFGDAKSGRPAVALVTGASGIGKSELLASFLAAREGEDSVLLHGRCHPQESVSYDGLDGAIDALSEWLLSLRESEREALLPEGVDALLDLFPVLGRVVRVTGRVDKPSEPLARRREGVAALQALLRRMCEERTVIVAIDDAHWGGADAGALLADLLREGAPSMLLVLAFREEDAATSPLLGVIRERAPDLLETVHRVALGPLDERASAELARQLIDHDRVDADAVTASVSAAAKGHPLFLRELALSVTASAGVGARSVDLETLLRERIAGLGPDERSLLDLASVAGRPIARGTLLAAAGQGEPGRLLLQKLGKRRLLRETTHGAEDAPTFEPYHAQIRDAALGAIEFDARRSAHRVLAEALMQDPEPPAELLVEHLAGAGARERAADYARIAAEQAERKLAFERASYFYRAAIDLGAGPKSRLSALLGAALGNAGESVAAAHAYGEAADAAREEGRSDAGELARLAAEHDLRGGNFERGIIRLKDVLRGAGVRYPSSALVAVADTLFFRTRLELRGLDFNVRRATEQDDSKLAHLDACWTAGLGHAWIDPIRAAAFQARYMVNALEYGEPRRIVRGLATEASQLACVGSAKRTNKARAMMRQVLDLLEPNDHVGRAFARCMSGSIEFYASRWRDAVDQCRLGEHVLETAKLRSEWEAMTSYTLSLASLAYLGDIRELRKRQHTLLGDARDRGNRLAETCLSSGPANVSWLAVDAPDEAERRADHALTPWQGEDFQLAHYFHLVAKVQIDLYRGCPGDALERLRREWRAVVLSMSLRVQNFRVTLRHLRARAAVATALSAGASANRSKLLAFAHKEALRVAREDVAWAAPLALATDAGILSASGDARAAADVLARAVVGFEALEMKLYANAARYARGQLLGGSEGRALVADGERAMLSEDVMRPDLMTAMLVPTAAR